MPTTKTAPSHVVKVTGMSDELLALLDARVRQQQATGRAEYIRELIRRDALTPDARLPEYHTLLDVHLRGEATAAQLQRLRQLEQEWDTEEAEGAEAREALLRQDEVSAKLDQLLALVKSLPKAAA